MRIGKHGIAALTAGLSGRTEPVIRAGDDIAFTVYASGATGVPEVTQLTHGELIRNGSIIARSVLDLGSDDIVMGCLPLFLGSGLSCGLLAAVSAEVTLVLQPRFNSRRVLEIVFAERVAVYSRARPRCSGRCSPQPTVAHRISIPCASACQLGPRYPRTR